MKKINNWILIGLLGGLVVIFIAMKIFRSPTLESNLPERLTEIDSAKVTELIVVPGKDRTSEVRLTKTGKVWTLNTGDRVGHLEQGRGNTSLQSLMNLKPQRVLTKRKEKWNEFGVGDSTGTHVRVMEGSSTKSDLWIGRTGFSQSSGSGYTYVRMEGEDEVYSVDGFLEGQFNLNFNDWRDKSFTRIKRDSIDKIIFRYPADSSFVLEKRNGKWKLGVVAADSAAVASYLSGMEYKNISAFAEVPPPGNAVALIAFEKNSNVIATLEAWPGLGAWTVRSSKQPDTFFSSDASVTKEVWKGRKAFEIK